MKKFGKVLLGSVLALGLGLSGGTLLAGCGENGSNNYNSEIHSIYLLAQEDGYTGTYEQWLASIKGEKGEKGEKGDKVEVLIGLDGYWYIDGVNTGVLARHIDRVYSVNYDDKYAPLFDDISTDEVLKGDWIVDMPIIKEQYRDDFLGWFIPDSNIQIKRGDFIYADIILEARFTRSFSGLYKNGKMIKSWEDLKEEFPNAFIEEESGVKIIADDFGSYKASYFSDLEGELVVNDEVAVIDDSAFEGCKGLARIFIPASVTEIGKRVFAYCTSLKTISVDAENMTYKEIDGCLIDIAEKEIISACTKCMIPDDDNIVTSIRTYAFVGIPIHDMFGNPMIKIPSNIRMKYTSAFVDCDLTWVEIDSASWANNLNGEGYTQYGWALYDGLLYKARQVFIKSDLDTSGSTFLLSRFTKQETCLVDGYDYYERNDWYTI